MALLNLALSVIEIGAGLSLNGSTLSATPGVSVKATRNASSSAVLTNADYYVGYTGAGGDTFTLPNAAGNAGVELIVKNRGSGDLTLDASLAGGLWTTSSVATMTLIVGESAHLISDGTSWIVAAMASGIIVP